MLQHKCKNVYTNAYYAGMVSVGKEMSTKHVVVRVVMQLNFKITNIEVIMNDSYHKIFKNTLKYIVTRDWTSSLPSLPTHRFSLSLTVLLYVATSKS